MTISKQLDVLQPPAAGPSWGVSCRCSCLGLVARIPPLFLFLVTWRTRGLSGSLACLFIYFKWPIPSAGLCQHGGPASCYYWPHTHTQHMRIQTCNIRTVIVWRHASTQKDTCASCASVFLDKEHGSTVYTWRNVHKLKIHPLLMSACLFKTHFFIISLFSNLTTAQK